MDKIKLTKDADALICVLYKEYLVKRKNGEPRSTAKCFGSSRMIHTKFIPKWSFQDVDDTCRELSRTGLLDCLFLDNIAGETALSDLAIYYMENRFKEGLSAVLSYLGSLISILPL